MSSTNITYYLPAYGGTGGTNSVVYDALEFKKFGYHSRIIAPNYVYSSLYNSYGDITEFESIFCFYDSTSISELAYLFKSATHLVATIWSSVEAIDMMSSSLNAKLFYFVQDYEPLFYEAGSNDYVNARKTYDNGKFCMYAKSQRIIDLVKAHHGKSVHRVLPSIRYDLFYPYFSKIESEYVVIGMMLRPSTRHRNAEGNLKAVKLACDRIKMKVKTFGCSQDVAEKLCADYGLVGEHYGFLKPNQVGALLRTCDLFIDLSIHQGFGRLGLEAAACGCACILPAVSGLSEILMEGVDCFYCDHTDEETAAGRMVSLALDPIQLKSMQISAATSAGLFPSHSAALTALEFIMNS